MVIIFTILKIYLNNIFYPYHMSAAALPPRCHGAPHFYLFFFSFFLPLLFFLFFFFFLLLLLLSLLPFFRLPFFSVPYLRNTLGSSKYIPCVLLLPETLLHDFLPCFKIRLVIQWSSPSLLLSSSSESCLRFRFTNKSDSSSSLS